MPCVSPAGLILTRRVLALCWHCAGTALALHTARVARRTATSARRATLRDESWTCPGTAPGGAARAAASGGTDEGASLVEHARDEVGDIVVHRLGRCGEIWGDVREMRLET